MRKLILFLALAALATTVWAQPFGVRGSGPIGGGSSSSSSGAITGADTGRDFLVEAPSSSTNYLVWHPNAGTTITGVDCLVDGGTSAVVDVKECDADGGSCASVLSSTITCATTNTTGTVSDGGITSGNRVQIAIGTVTGTVPSLTVRINYSVP